MALPGNMQAGRVQIIAFWCTQLAVLGQELIADY